MIDTNWIYCGSESAVDSAGTQDLLRNHQAIWCSPPGLRPWPGIPHPGDRIWLVWRNSPATEIVQLLGGGRIQKAPRALFGTILLWTERDTPGLRAAAESLGYEAGNAMSFLRLEAVVFPNAQTTIHGLGGISTRLNVATEEQFSALYALLPID